MPVADVIDKPLPHHSPENTADAIIHQIIKIGQLSKLEENWDSYGGKAILMEVCEKAAKYLYAAFAELSTELESIVMPFIAPANDGSIVFEWKSATAELIVVFRPNNQLDVEYLTIEKDKSGEKEKDGIFNSATAFVQAVKWFLLHKVEND